MHVSTELHGSPCPTGQETPGRSAHCRFYPDKNQTDSLALADTTDLQRQLKLETLEAPVDTALLARQNDSIQNSIPAPQEKKRWIPNSNRTVWLGLIIPGAGQIYNRKYWKLPLIYGGFVGCAYALTWNGQMYKDYSQAYQDIMSNNPNNKATKISCLLAQT